MGGKELFSHNLFPAVPVGGDRRRAPFVVRVGGGRPRAPAQAEGRAARHHARPRPQGSFDYDRLCLSPKWINVFSRLIE